MTHREYIWLAAFLALIKLYQNEKSTRHGAGGIKLKVLHQKILLTSSLRNTIPGMLANDVEETEYSLRLIPLAKNDFDDFLPSSTTAKLDSDLDRQFPILPFLKLEDEGGHSVVFFALSADIRLRLGNESAKLRQKSK